ncbi:MAG: M28 family peptidase [Gemmatimonadota bacterium]
MDPEAQRAGNVGRAATQRGLPTLQFFTGFHPEYHQPTDDVETIDFGKLTRIARLAYEIAVGIANDPDLEDLGES